MKNRKIKNYQLRAQVAKALGHSSRMLILDALKEADLCVADLTELVGSDQSTVSKHIAVLKNAGLIEARKKGLHNYYTLLCPCIQDFFDCLEKVVSNNAKRYQKFCKC